MSQVQVPSTTPSSTDFQTIFTTALEAYKQQTKTDISSHPLAAQLQSCDSPTAILAVLRAQSQSVGKEWTKWLDPIVNVLYASSAILGTGVGLIFAPSNVVFSGIGILLQAIKDVRASQDALGDIFGRMEYFFKRLEAYIEIRPTVAMIDIVVKIMVEVLSILGIVTKEIRQGKMKKYLVKLVGRKDVEDALQRLDKLTQEEARMAAVEVLTISRGIDDKVKDVDEKVEGVDGRVQSVDIKVEGIDDKVRCVNRKVQGVDHKVGSVIRGVKENGIAIQQVVDQFSSLNRNELRKDLRKWVAPPDPSINYNAASSTHHEGTTAWCTKGDTLANWKTSGSLLWIHGKPGSGKSILSSVIIQHIKTISVSGSACMAYFFFDFKDKGKQDSRALLSSLLIQLSNQSAQFCEVLLGLFSAHEDGSEQPTNDSLAQCLKDMLTIAGQIPIYLIMDALDECPNDSGIPTPREMVLGLVKELIELRRPNLRICITSRPEFDIHTVFGPLATQQLSLHDEGGQKQDIIDYITSVVHTDRKMKSWGDDDKDAVIEKLTQKAEGMFRWVFCQLEVLRHCVPTNLRRVLEQLPKSLDETYERILKAINDTNREQAYRLLQYLTVAIRPLRVEELAELLATDPNVGGIPKLNANWRWEDQEAVLSACAGLVSVIIENGSRVVQFSHSSVKDFLTSSRLASSPQDVSRFHIPFEAPHVMLSQACLGVLLPPR
ncbi:hypothetical protein EDB85DRAFT_609212 [Lactarius pseudohatsudake]|nr:hypothetical protein EDB85DRAFT_609212 [Lactarius pseudohatsudake]